MASLQDKGLRGYFVISQVHGNARYLHHEEAALLVGLPATMQFVHTARGNLALIGLVASPLQMIWVYSTLLKNYHHALGRSGCPDPEAWLRAYQHELLRQTEGTFRSPQGVLPHIRIQDADREMLYVLSATSCSAGQLLAAHRICLEWNEAGGITRDGRHLPLHQLMDLTTEPYMLISAAGPLERSKPEGLVMIAIVHLGQLDVLFLHAGQFIFQALRDHEIHDVNFLVDDEGKIYGADFRIWKSIRLTTLPNWPPRLSPTLQGFGIEPSQSGLHEGHIWHALCSMITTIPLDQRPLLAHPRTALAILAGTWNHQVWDLAEKFHASAISICSIFHADEHWALLWGERCADGIIWIYCDGLPGKAETPAGLLAGKLNNILGLQEWDIMPKHNILQLAPHTCGTIALLHAGLCLGLFGIPNESSILQLHEWLFQRRLPGSLHANGLSKDQLDSLHTLLQDHGVPPGNVAERAQQVLLKLGPSAVIEALKAKNKWAYLKALASTQEVWT